MVCVWVWARAGLKRARPMFKISLCLGWDCGCGSRGNDPSAGSPTETLLRLHLPLNDEV